MTRRLLTIATLITATAAIAVSTPTTKPNKVKQADKPSIAAQAAAIIKAKCVDCHSGAGLPPILVPSASSRLFTVSGHKVWFVLCAGR